MIALAAATAATAQTLKSPADYGGIADPAARSAAMFEEMGKVISSPRCMNCHPADRQPKQGGDRATHIPAVLGGPDGRGIPGLPCTACHMDRNTPVIGDRIKSVPGNPKWALAPAEMAWEGKSLGEICRQLKDPDRNRHRDLEALWRHIAFDSLVGWAWSPGEGRQPAPGSQAAFGALAKAWIGAGAGCPGS